MQTWQVNPDHTEAFIQRWQEGGGTERANYQLFLLELCELLDLPKPDPAGDDNRDNAYVFERRVRIKNPDGSETHGFIDLYKRGSFVLEAKQSGLNTSSSGWNRAMLKAHNQADNYVRALPANEGRPPFILVTDVGRSLELYAEFSCSGATYTPFPDARNHRLKVTDLRKPEIQHRLRQVWLNPLSLDPSRIAAQVTKDIANQLAKLAKSLEAQGYDPQVVAEFMMRALFTMFAEDVGLLPKNAFEHQLEELKDTPEIFVDMLESLWQNMNNGGFSAVLRTKVLMFNGGLFANQQALPLNREQIELLLNAAKADWTYVEPAIFGTLLERALNPKERHKLGAHYTPRAYVERLVFPTVIEPLRQEWQEVQAAALAYEKQNKHKEAVAQVQNFHRYLCQLRILDPACGSGNFLYVTLEHMKRLEGEVLNLLGDLGETGTLEAAGLTIDPHQFLGLEINPRAARIAEMVLWIGYLQWHYRTHGNINPPEPVLRDFKNIENRDALLNYSGREVLTDEQGQPLTRWDGNTKKISPVTGEEIPDETAQVEDYRYLNPSKAEWPQADFIVGNPPFIGEKRMREALGDGYVEAVREVYSELPACDFVMYWWHIAAETIRAGKAQQFGFITTNSIKQTFNRRVVLAQLEAKKSPLTLAFAIPDHPWVDAADAAAVRIAMTVGALNLETGRLLEVEKETANKNKQDEINVQLSEKRGTLYADLKVGINITKAKTLAANLNISQRGFELGNAGFILDKEAYKKLIKDVGSNTKIIREYRNGRDITDKFRDVKAIDAHGYDESELRSKFPQIYQWLLERVKPERLQNRDARLQKFWWLHRRSREDLRKMLSGVSRYITTVETMKQRVFLFLDTDVLPDNKLINTALTDAFYLGVLSSRVHTLWALSAGSILGPTPVYVKTTCFETFPFPAASEEQQAKIRDLAERLDAHRKRQQELHPSLTLTNMYNVLEKLRTEEPLTVKEKTTHEQGLVSVLKELHDELDEAVFAAYDWEDLAEKLVGLPGATTPLPNKPTAQAEAEEELLKRLVDLNAQRAAEEAQGKVRWLRPEYQDPNWQNEQHSLAATSLQTTPAKATACKPAARTRVKKIAWPKGMREQIAAVRKLLQEAPQTSQQLATRFTRNPLAKVEEVLAALEDMGLVHQEAILENSSETYLYRLTVNN